MFNRIKKYALAGLATCAIAAPVAIVTGLVVQRKLAPAAIPTGAAAQAPSGFWDRFRFHADYAEDFESLKDMRAAADAVVIGRITDVQTSRVFQGDAKEDVVVFGKLIVAVDTLVSGTVEDTVEVEFIVPTSAERAPGALEKMKQNRPGDSVMLFLRKSKLGIHWWINDFGVWIERDGIVTAPLAIDEGAAPEFLDKFGSASVRYAKELAGVRALSDLAVAVFR